MSFEVNSQEYMRQLENICIAVNDTPSLPLEPCNGESTEELLETERKKTKMITLELKHWRQRVYELEKVLKTLTRELKRWEVNGTVQNEVFAKTNFMEKQEECKSCAAETIVSEPRTFTLETKGEKNEHVSNECEINNQSNLELSGKVWKSVEKCNEREEARNGIILLTKAYTDLLVEEELERIDLAVNEQEVRRTIQFDFKMHITKNISIFQNMTGGHFKHHDLVNLYAANKIVMTNQLLIEWIEELMGFTNELIHHQTKNSILESKINECDVINTHKSGKELNSSTYNNVSKNKEKIESSEKCRFERHHDTIVRVIDNESNEKENCNDVAVWSSSSDTNSICSDHAPFLFGNRTELQNNSEDVEDNDYNVTDKRVESVYDDEERQEPSGNVHKVNIDECELGEINRIHNDEGSELVSSGEIAEEVNYAHSNLDTSHRSIEELVTNNNYKAEEEEELKDLHESNNIITIDNNATFSSNTREINDVAVSDDHTACRIDNNNCNGDSDEDASSYEDINVGFDPFA